MKNQWEEQIKRKIRNLYYNRKVQNLDELLPLCEGAQPKDLDRLLSEIKAEGSPSNQISLDYKNKFYYNLPAANPLFYQWWYTLSSQENFVQKIIDETDAERTLCIGTPTIAATLKSYQKYVSLLDIDIDLIDLFNTTFKDKTGVHYDVHDELDSSFEKQFDCVVIDPPWYEEYFYLFIKRAISASKNGGIIYCSIPQRLTRESIEKERNALISTLTSLGHELLYIESSTVQYIVPEFESKVFSNSNLELTNQPWRYSDLIVIRVNNKNTPTVSHERPSNTLTFSRENMTTLFRVFLSEQDIETGIGLNIVPEFSKSISRRDSVNKVNLWTSNKLGYQVEDHITAKEILGAWQSGSDKKRTVQLLQNNGYEINVAQNLVNVFDEKLFLWEKHADGPVRRTEEEIKNINSQSNSQWAQNPNNREFGSKSDGFRIEFQRDRDRVIWSNGFRKLADKTQLFPLNEDENLRQRLAHSIEVMQLATTISSSFGLDKDLVEAGALAHDIGHTPFGHAGENAIDRLFTSLGFECGFNHYEHGVDVVRYLEGSYQQNIFESHPGLNLTPDVCDCILKHTYCHSGGTGSHKDVWDKSKHQKFIGCSGFSHLEGQAVRAADKISYLLSDIEDGIRLDIITHQDLMNCRLFHRAPIDFRMKPSDSLYVKFIQQRGAIIKLLMEDIILESSKRISRLSSKKDVRTAGDYCIFHGPEIQSDMNEIWIKIQSRKLHCDSRVLSANMNASKIVSELLILYILYPEHIDDKFRVEHERLRESDYIKFYNSKKEKFNLPNEFTSFLPLNMMIGFNFNDLKNINTYDLVLAKDYVASLSDNKIRHIHKKLLRT
ncbi:dNTP triphosphohydrolase [Vibrio kanaloae]|uniref:dGTP triphosphohydrolase n=1 Tax=Vibrio kanaloae TaxID=170673 RepID=UPI0011B70E62|nr:dNTP triphosphohydrolase [Vibrio kanaloae]